MDRAPQRYFEAPITEQEIEADAIIEETVSEHKEGLGVLEFMKHIYDKTLFFALKHLMFRTTSHKKENQMIQAFQLLSQRLDQLEHKTNVVKSSMRRLANSMRNALHWELALNTLEEYIRTIHVKYNRFNLYQGLTEKVENQTLLEFVRQIVSHDRYSILSLMGDLHGMAAPHASKPSALDLSNRNGFFSTAEATEGVSVVTGRREIRSGRKKMSKDRVTFRSSVFQMLNDAAQEVDSCTLNQSPQQLIRGLYVLLAITEARGFAMLEFSWMALRLHGEGNFTTEQEMSEYLYMKYSEDILHEAQQVMTKASRDFNRCDPESHTEGKTFVRFTNFLQGYIENEVNMNNKGTCKKNCGYYLETSQRQCYSSGNQLCEEQPLCQGTLRDCKFYDADAWVCLSSDQHRRYDYIRYESGQQLGYDGVCNGTQRKVDSWYRWFYHCSYCLCLCDNENLDTSDRYISLMDVLSDIENNMVVTGVKFTKVGQAIHLVIQEGKAMPYGDIDISTLRWVDVESIDTNRMEYGENVNYKRLSYEERGFDLDRLEGPSNHVLTGIKFRVLGTHINIQVRVTPIESTTGKLIPSGSYWIQNNKTPDTSLNPRRELKLSKPRDPTTISFSNKEDSTSNSYVLFGPTSRTFDVAQLTIPFFDAQEVYPSPVSWLSGIDLFHKGQKYSGGFVTLKVITYNLSNFRN